MSDLSPSILSHLDTHFCLLLPQLFASSFTDLCQYLTVPGFEGIFLCWNSELGQLSKWPEEHIREAEPGSYTSGLACSGTTASILD